MTTFTVLVSKDMGGSQNFSDYDDESEEYDCPEQEKAMRHFQSVFLPVFYSLIFVLGIAGNSFMITVLLRRLRSLRITEIYLLHLALADLMFLFTYPIYAADAMAQ
ncbi:hypothetical protein WMY93_029195 [Mugilogobius chulae]|uniref:G-protein coupled receptors family 1 profile domain-containing protein n=1 Tax=Mugilogobius chulae TaxID=88201 RepID=A0AAW0MWJ9_9GOBI